MKPILITIALLAVLSSAKAQLEKDDKKIYNVVEQEPEFPGGMTNFFKFLAANFKYPKTAADAYGKIIIEFIVEKDGTMSHIHVMKPLLAEFNAEALRVMKLSPKWKPGEQNGKIVRVRYEIPINIEIQGE